MIACGAGFAEGMPPARDLPVRLLRRRREPRLQLPRDAAARRDARRARGDASARRLRRTARLAAAGRAARGPIEWMELQAMKSGARPRDAALVGAVARAPSAEAAALETAGQKGEALARYREIAQDFDGQADLAAVRAAAARLESGRRRGPAARGAGAPRAGGGRDSLPRSPRSSSRICARTIRSRPTASPRTCACRRCSARRNRTRAKRRASRRNGFSPRSSVQTSFYMPREFLQHHDSRRAQLCIAVALQVAPERAGAIWYNFACLAGAVGRQEGIARGAAQRARERVPRRRAGREGPGPRERARRRRLPEGRRGDEEEHPRERASLARR